MRVRTWMLLAFLAGGCVDITRPPELQGGGDGGIESDAAPLISDTSADLAGSHDLMMSPGPGGGDAGGMVDAATPLDASTPDLALPPDQGAPLADAAMPADAAVPADAAAPDAALPPDAPPPPPPDLAPDHAPDVAPDSAPPPLVIDDFTSGPKNNLGSEVTWDHATCNRVSGEMICTWAG